MNVPAWRLFLSRGLSRLYGLVLRKRIHTFTSCFRVYRRSAILALELEEQGFIGIAETLIRLLGSGGRVVEYPTTLETRLLGQSKMKVVKTISQHLFFLAKLLTERRKTG